MSNSTYVQRAGIHRSSGIVAIVAAALALAVATPSAATGHIAGGFGQMPGNGCGTSGC